MPPGAELPAGAKSRVRTAPGAALALLLGLAGACSTPVVAAQAVWIGEDREPDGSRTLFAYSAGTITTSALRPLGADADAVRLPLLVELEPRGRGALIRGADAGWLHDLGDSSGLRAGYLDLSRRRALPLWVPSTQVAVDGARFSNSGDALMWVEGCGPELAVVPLVAGLPLASEVHGGSPTTAPLRRTIGEGPARPLPRACAAAAAFGLASPADAPRVFVVEADAPASASGAPRVGALLEAVRVPAEADEAAALELLAQARLPADFTPAWLFSARCPGSAPCGLAAADPDGEALLVGGAGPCRLLRWEVASGAFACALPADAPAELAAAQLVAAISSELLVLRDELRLHRYNWRTGELRSRPLPAAGTGLFVRVSQDGRAVMAVSSRGVLFRISAEGIELISIEQRPCADPQPPVFAPSGRVAAWTCAAVTEPGTSDPAISGVGEVFRVSAAGLEKYQGVPMWALAIDDAGDLLLSSRRSSVFSHELQLPAQSPGNLYVLSGEGVLERIDGLEPNPEVMVGLAAGTFRWIHAQPL